MAMQMSLGLRQTQVQVQEQTLELRIGPRALKQLHVLEASRDELTAMVREEAESNPLVDFAEDAPRSGAPTDEWERDDEAPSSSTQPYGWYGHSSPVGNPAEVTRSRDAWFESQPAPKPIGEVLREELAFIRDPDSRAASLKLIEHMDVDGLLCTSLDSIATESGIDVGELERAREGLAEVSPGLGAESRQQGLVDQLEALDEDKNTAVRDLAIQLITASWSIGSLRHVPRLLGVSKQAVNEAVSFIVTKLRLSPASAIDHDGVEPEIIKPDLEAFFEGERAVVRPVSMLTGCPCKSAAEAAAALGEIDHQTAAFLAQQERRVEDLFGALNRRNETLVDVARHALDCQPKEFFEGGWQYHHSVSQRSAAEALGCHPGTISRATSGKWIRLPFTTRAVPLADLFSAPASIAMPNGLSVRAVRSRIRDLIDNEDPLMPASDQAISLRLAEELDVRLSDRTVCNHRRAVGLPGARERRKWGTPMDPKRKPV